MAAGKCARPVPDDAASGNCSTERIHRRCCAPGRIVEIRSEGGVSRSGKRTSHTTDRSSAGSSISAVCKSIILQWPKSSAPPKVDLAECSHFVLDMVLTVGLYT